MATILVDELKLTPELTWVELNPEGINLARKYFKLERFTQLTLHLNDAATFAETSK